MTGFCLRALAVIAVSLSVQVAGARGGAVAQPSNSSKSSEQVPVTGLARLNGPFLPPPSQKGVVT